MATKSKKHLNFYKRCIESRELPTGLFLGVEAKCGLCKLASMRYLDTELLGHFEPTEKDLEWLEWEGHNTIFWGSDSPDEQLGVFTPLRQTIVLFMAAMNGEL